MEEAERQGRAEGVALLRSWTQARRGGRSATRLGSEGSSTLRTNSKRDLNDGDRPPCPISPFWSAPISLAVGSGGQLRPRKAVAHAGRGGGAWTAAVPDP